MPSETVKLIQLLTRFVIFNTCFRAQSWFLVTRRFRTEVPDVVVAEEADGDDREHRGDEEQDDER